MNLEERIKERLNRGESLNALADDLIKCARERDALRDKARDLYRVAFDCCEEANGNDGVPRCYACRLDKTGHCAARAMCAVYSALRRFGENDRHDATVARLRSELNYIAGATANYADGVLRHIHEVAERAAKGGAA